MSLEPISKSFSNFSSRHELTNRLQATEIVRVANKVAAGQFKAISYKNRILRVASEDPSDRYLLASEIDRIITQINTELGHDLISSIKFRLNNPTELD